MADTTATAPKVETTAPATTTTAPSGEVKVTAPAAAAPATTTMTAVTKATSQEAAPVAPWMKTEPAKPEAEAKKEDPKAEVKYELKVPDGVSMDASALEGYVSFSKEHGLTPAQAQKLLDRDVAQKKASDEALWSQIRKTDEDNLKALQSAYGDGFGEYAETVKRGLDHVDPDGELRKEIASIGVAHHKRLTDAFHKVGLMLKNDSLRTPAAAGTIAKDERTPHEKARAHYATKMAEQMGKVVRK